MSATARSVVNRNAIALLAAVVVLVVLGQFLNQHYLGLMINLLVAILFAMSFNLLFGYTGLLSFGHSAFYGGGAYVMAIVLTGGVEFIPEALQSSFIGALVVSALVTMVLAAIIGSVCVQRGALFFAMLTLGFAMILYQVSRTWRSVTGGSNGIILLPPDINLGVVSFSPSEPMMYYYFTLAIVVLSLLLLRRIANSPFGEILTSIRENPERARYLGLRVTYYQWAAFTLSGLFAGIAGALISVRTFVISPATVHWSVSADPVLMSLIGGTSYFYGPVIGATIFIGLEEFVSGFFVQWQLVLGLILIPIVLFAPGGVIGVWRDHRDKLGRVREWVSGLR